MFAAPAHPARLSGWDDLTPNERGWIEMIRVISAGSDPAVDLESTAALRQVPDCKRD